MSPILISSFSCDCSGGVSVRVKAIVNVTSKIETPHCDHLNEISGESHALDSILFLNLTNAFAKEESKREKI